MKSIWSKIYCSFEGEFGWPIDKVSCWYLLLWLYWRLSVFFFWCYPSYKTNALTLNKYRFEIITLIIIESFAASSVVKKSIFCQMMLHVLFLRFRFAQNTSLDLILEISCLCVCMLETKSIYVVLVTLELM